MTHSRKEELPKEDARMAYMRRQRHKLEAHWGDESNASESTAELHAGGEVLRAGSGSTHWELFVFTVSPHCGTTRVFALLVCVCFLCGAVFVGFCWVTGIPLFCIWCTRSLFIPRLSPSSWWAQRRSKKKDELQKKSCMRSITERLCLLHFGHTCRVQKVVFVSRESFWIRVFAVSPFHSFFLVYGRHALVLCLFFERFLFVSRALLFCSRHSFFRRDCTSTILVLQEVSTCGSDCGLGPRFNKINHRMAYIIVDAWDVLMEKDQCSLIEWPCLETIFTGLFETYRPGSHVHLATPPQRVHDWVQRGSNCTLKGLLRAHNNLFVFWSCVFPENLGSCWSQWWPFFLQPKVMLKFKSWSFGT